MPSATGAQRVLPHKLSNNNWRNNGRLALIVIVLTKRKRDEHFGAVSEQFGGFSLLLRASSRNYVLKHTSPGPAAGSGSARKVRRDEGAGPMRAATGAILIRHPTMQEDCVVIDELSLIGR